MQGAIEAKIWGHFSVVRNQTNRTDEKTAFGLRENRIELDRAPAAAQDSHLHPRSQLRI